MLFIIILFYFFFKDEQDRIKNMGGAVIFWCTVWRVNGQLAITRAIGKDCYVK